NTQILRKPERIHWSVKEATKEGHPHYMLKEIFEQPRILKESLRQDEKLVEEFAGILNDSDYIAAVAEGTSNFAAIAGRYQMSKLAERVVDAPNASEFIESMSNSLWRFKNPCLILISQSGETYDVIQAAKYAKEHGAKILALTNNIGSSIYRMADKAINIHAGP